MPFRDRQLKERNSECSDDFKKITQRTDILLLALTYMAYSFACSFCGPSNVTRKRTGWSMATCGTLIRGQLTGTSLPTAGFWQPLRPHRRAGALQFIQQFNLERGLRRKAIGLTTNLAASTPATGPVTKLRRARYGSSGDNEPNPSRRIVSSPTPP